MVSPTVAVLALSLLGWSLPAVQSIRQVSFYGDSFLSMPVRDSSSSTLIGLQFSTRRRDGLLFYAAGKTGSCLIQLKDGEIRMKMNMGHGEVSLDSPPGSKFNDLIWHNMKLHRTKRRLTLTVDYIIETSVNFPGFSNILTIDRGIFVGAAGHYAPYRGCLRNVVFNSINVLESVRAGKARSKAEHVTWDCSKEFSAPTGKTLSFAANDSSHITFSHLPNYEVAFSYHICTKTMDAVLLYNSGRWTRKDFVAVVIKNGYPRLLCNKGTSVKQLQSDRKVSDGGWHTISLEVGSSFMYLTVDGNRKSFRFFGTDTSYLDLDGSLYVGGVSDRESVGLKQRGISPVGLSFDGCLKNMKIGQGSVGVPDVLTSRSIKLGCLWKYPCSTDPCIERGTCTEVGFDQFQCHCDQTKCVRSTTLLTTTESVTENIVQLVPFITQEGKSKVITMDNINILFERRKFRISESAILFHIRSVPKFGKLNINVRHRTDNDVFTFLDLKLSKIAYEHDGSENFNDSLGLDFEIFGRGKRLPEHLRKVVPLKLDIIISPVNDPPTIHLPPNDTVRMDGGATRFTIDPSVFHVTDPDSDQGDLIIDAMYPQGIVHGHLEHRNKMGEKLISFKPDDITNGLIDLVLRDEEELSIAFQASDGALQSIIKVLRIVFVSSKPLVENNTGVMVDYFGASFITQTNLSMVTRSKYKASNLKYIIVKEPNHGEIQQYNTNTKNWVKATRFSQKHVNKKQVRYIHLTPFDEDVFTFRGRFRNVETMDTKVHIKIKNGEIEVVNNAGVVLEGVWEFLLNTSILAVRVNSQAQLNQSKVVYNILRAPLNGELCYNKRKCILQHFTQDDIQRGRISYHHRQSPNYPSRDTFTFRVVGYGGEIVLNFSVEFVPRKTYYDVVNVGLINVTEGQSWIIGKENLYITIAESMDATYYLQSHPRHGQLDLRDPNAGTIIKSNISQFTNQNILSDQLFYHHDNSESDRDWFKFSVVLPTGVTPESEAENYTGVFNVLISLQNDNKPDRTVDRVFHVVRNKAKVITGSDLSFHDPDVNFDSKDLLYQRRKLANGKIVLRSDRTEVYQFTQEDVNERRLMFVHSGASIGRSMISVTDGKYKVFALFEVEASIPFIKIINNTGLQLIQGGSVQLTSSNISIQSNIDFSNKEVLFRVISPPHFGGIYHIKKSSGISRFTLEEIKGGYIIYRHDNSNNLSDKFEYSVKVGNSKIQAVTKVNILLEIYLLPPVLINNNVIILEEMTTGKIDQHHLLTSHNATLPHDIQYDVTTPPSCGKLLLTGQRQVTQFNQLDVDARRLSYSHTTQYCSEDFFEFDVTNHVRMLIGIKFHIEIIPRLVPVSVESLVVKEGGKISLTAESIMITNKHYAGVSFVYDVISRTRHGRLESTEVVGVRLDRFTTSQLESGAVCYIHDGSEVTSDTFSFVARSLKDGKKSVVHQLSIDVTPVNDRRPVIKVNKGLFVWVGSITVVTKSHLLAFDEDSPPSNVTFVVTSPTNGRLTLTSAMKDDIHTFTQQQINERHVQFIHKGADSGSFKFQANDGIHFCDQQTLHIWATQVTLNFTVTSRLRVYPGNIQEIMENNLKVISNDRDPGRLIHFTIRDKPKYGRIVKILNGSAVTVTSYTDKDVEQGIIAYQHLSVISGWLETDAIVFDITSKYAAPLIMQRLPVTISYDYIGLAKRNALVLTNRLTVIEGGNAKITTSHLNLLRLVSKLHSLSHARRGLVKFIVTSLPRYGYLVIASQNATVGSYFLQPDLEQKRIEYYHDDSDTLWDSFNFTTHVTGSVTANHLPAFNMTYNITIQPINDQQFKVVTRNPVIVVLQGSNVTLTSRILLTIDSDTPPENLTYKIISQPINGQLTNKWSQKTLSSFTQADIDNSEVTFTSNLSKEKSVFHARVTDGRFSPSYIVITVNVIPLTVDLVTNLGAKIVQSHTSTIISSDALNASTNGNVGDIIFNVTSQPAFGVLYIFDQRVKQFCQVDLDEGRLIYLQTDMSSSNDLFVFNVYNKNANDAKSSQFNISVEALVQQGVCNVSSSSRVAITLDVLDASELHASTGSVPIYDVISPPNYGRILRRPLRKRSADLINATSFTHQDVADGRVFYLANRFRGDATWDSFRYRLTAKNSQPAIGELRITLNPVVRQKTTTVIYSETKGSTGASSGEGYIYSIYTVAGDHSVSTTSLYSSTMSVTNIGQHNSSQSDSFRAGSVMEEDDLLLIVALVTGILVIVLVIVALIFVKKRQDKRTMCVNESRGIVETFKHSGTLKSTDSIHSVTQADTIPESKDPNLRGEQDKSRSQVNRTVPQCKVTQIVEYDPVTDKQQFVIDNSLDIDLLDPDLIPDVRQGNPALRDSMHWV